LKDPESYRPYTSMQDAEAYDLTQVIQQVRNMKTTCHAGE